MAVNLYDNPAQSTFVNTYVPIKFDQLYKMADNDRADFKEAQARLDDLSSMSSLNSASKSANDAYKNIYDNIAGDVSTYINDPELLKNKANQNALASIKRKLVSDRNFSILVANKPRYEQYLAKEDERWGGIGQDDVDNANPYELWTKQNIAYEDPNKLLQEKLPETVIGNPVRLPGGLVKTTTGVSMDQVNKLSDEQAKLHSGNEYWSRVYKMDRNKGILNPDSFVNSDGSVDMNKYLKYKSIAANAEQVYEKVDYTRENRPQSTRVSIGGSPDVNYKNSYVQAVQNDVNKSYLNQTSNAVFNAVENKLRNDLKDNYGNLSYDEYVRLPQSKNKPVTRDAYTYIINSNKLSSVQAKRQLAKAQADKTGDPSYTKQVEQYDAAIKNLSHAIEKAKPGFEIYVDAQVVGLGKKDNIYTASEHNKASVVPVYNQYVDDASKFLFGEPKDVPVGMSTQKAYSPRNNDQFSIVNANTLLTPEKENPTYKTMSNVLKSPALQGRVQFIPDAKARRIGDKTIKMFGKIRVSEEDMKKAGLTESALHGQFPSAQAFGKSKGTVTGYREESPKDIYGPKGEVVRTENRVFYYIPVAVNKDVDINEAFSGSVEKNSKGSENNALQAINGVKIDIPTQEYQEN